MMFYDRDPLSDVDDAVCRYSPREFMSPARSTVPLMSLIKHGRSLWTEIARHLGVDAEAAEVHLEYTVPSPRGRGKPSHTDVMIIGPDRAYAVEAKWTEPRYESVEAWLQGGDDPSNRRAVMEGWLSLLRPYATQALDTSAFSGAVYQMVHRAASACGTGLAPTLVYLLFLPRPDGHPTDVDGLLRDLMHLHRLLGGPAGFQFYLIEVDIAPLAAFDQVSRMPKRSSNTAAAVRDALRGGPLFEFTSWRLRQVPSSHQPVFG